jgi:DUF1680 family protein
VISPRPHAAAPVVPTPGAIARLHPLGAVEVAVTGGFWLDRLEINRTRTLQHGFEQLKRAGNIENFRLAAGMPGMYRALGAPQGLVFPFLDSDVYKWLEGVGWELARGRNAQLESAADEAIAAIIPAQRGDGYINTFVQVIGGEPYHDLAWGHELYCVGHLIQAAVAWHRSVADDRLLEVALRAVESVDAALGRGGRRAIDGHPEIEMALVELYRVTADRRHLELAAEFVERRGHGLLGAGRFGSEYWQDHSTVRSARSVAGHAVRQLYLDCGVVDVATELNDRQLLAAVVGRWDDMVATRTYLTGGVGSRHRDEAFGDPYELPPDRAYNETCAAIASVMLAWRLLLASGESKYADLIERTMFNGVLAGSALDGTSFFYVNPLQRRTERVSSTHGAGPREPWYACACCPPNLMRTLSTWPQLLATTTDDEIQVHQFADAKILVATADGPATLSMSTGYPWTGEVRVTVEEAPPTPLSLSLRMPSWCGTAWVESPERPRRRIGVGERTVSERRVWGAGDTVTLDLEMTVRETFPDPRIDAIRGTIAFERGPLVYAIESADLPEGIQVEQIELADDHAAMTTPRADVAPGLLGLSLRAHLLPSVEPSWPYDSPQTGVDHTARSAASTIEIGAIPYYAWANRPVDGMRVWIPRSVEVGEATEDGQDGTTGESLSSIAAPTTAAAMSTGGRPRSARTP